MRPFPALLALGVLGPFCGVWAAGDGAGVRAAALPLLLAVFGLGTVLARELVRRCGTDWRGLALVGAALGLLHAGLVADWFGSGSLGGQDLVGRYGVVALGSAVLAVVAYHAVFAVLLPVGLVELAAGDERRPWLGPAGLVAVGLGWAASLLTLVLTAHDGSPLPTDGTVVLLMAAGVLAAAGLVVPRPVVGPPGALPADGPPLLVVALLAALVSGLVTPALALVLGGPGSGVGAVVLAGQVALLAGTAVVGTAWLRAGWHPLHTVAACLGASVTLVWWPLGLTALLLGRGVAWDEMAGLGVVALLLPLLAWAAHEAVGRERVREAVAA